MTTPSHPNATKCIFDLWVHPFHSTEWTLASYTKLLSFHSHTDFCIILNNIQHWDSGFYYLMKSDFPPLWEHPSHLNGGSWSFKLLKHHVNKFWIHATSLFLQNAFIPPNSHLHQIVGISISPKAKFATIRLWTIPHPSTLSPLNTNLPPIDFSNALFRNTL